MSFTTLFFIILALAAALMLGWGRRPARSRRAAGRGEPDPRSRQARGGGRQSRSEKGRGGFKAGGKFGVSHQRDRITVEVNPGKCARFGFCEHEAPEVFYLESDGRFGYQASVPISKMEQVISAMDVCPRRAIKVKLPPEHAETRVRPDLPPEDARRTIIPITERPREYAPGEGPRRPR